MNRFLLTMSIIILLVVSCFAGNNNMHLAAPIFSGTTIDGQFLSLTDYKGRVVLLNFWTSASQSCREDFPFLMKLHDKAKRGAFALVAINVDADASKLKAVLAQLQTQPGFPIMSDAQGKILSLFALKNIPATLVLDKKGFVRYRHYALNHVEQERLATEIKTLLVE